jgi:hypothetical protein
MRRKRRLRWDPKVLMRLYFLAETGASAPQIAQVLEQEFDPEAVPSERSVYNLLRDRRDSANTEPWSTVGSDLDDGPIVLPVIAASLKAGYAWPTKELASWIVHVRRLAPEMPLDRVWEFAAHYRTATAMGDAEDRWVRQLDAYMALELWRSVEAEMEALNNQWVPAVWWQTEEDRVND